MKLVICITLAVLFGIIIGLGIAFLIGRALTGSTTPPDHGLDRILGDKDHPETPLFHYFD